MTDPIATLSCFPCAEATRIREMHAALVGDLGHTGLLEVLRGLERSLAEQAQTLDKLVHTVHGNGEPGLDERVRALEGAGGGRPGGHLAVGATGMVGVIVGATLDWLARRLGLGGA